MEDRSAVKDVSKLANKLRRKLETFRVEGEFSGTQGKVLQFLLTTDRDIFQKDIEEEYSVRAASASQLLAKMEQNGLIQRESVDYDSRLKKIVLTDKAMQYKDEVIVKLGSLERELTSGIDAKDMAAFYRVMDQMMENMK